MIVFLISLLLVDYGLKCVDFVLVRQGQNAVILGIQILSALESYTS